MHREPVAPTLYGLLAEFEDPQALTEAAKRTYEEGYRKTDAYSPFPIEHVWEAMGVNDRPVSFFVLCGGIVGMWLERFVIIVTSLHRDFLPSSWGMYYPTFWDFSTFFGTIGLFTTLMFLFVRLLPMISIFEVRTLVPQARVNLKHDAAVDDFDVTYGAD